MLTKDHAEPTFPCKCADGSCGAHIPYSEITIFSDQNWWPTPIFRLGHWEIASRGALCWLNPRPGKSDDLYYPGITCEGRRSYVTELSDLQCIYVLNSIKDLTVDTAWEWLLQHNLIRKTTR